MADYKELVGGLRSASTVSTAWEKMMLDAAAAIEELEAEADALVHDNERYIQFNTDLLNTKEVSKAKAEANEEDGGAGMILVKDLIEWAKENAVGRSVSYPDGAIRSLDLLRLATDCYGAEPLTYNPQNGERRFRYLGQEAQE